MQQTKSKTVQWKCGWCAKTSPTAQGRSGHERSAHPEGFKALQAAIDKGMSREQFFAQRRGEDKRAGTVEVTPEPSELDKAVTQVSVDEPLNIPAEFERMIAKINHKLPLVTRRIEELEAELTQFRKKEQMLAQQRDQLEATLAAMRPKEEVGASPTFPSSDSEDRRGELVGETAT